MHILLLILKIIGIVLLVLLSIILILLLLLLFMPFCYRAEGSYYEEKPYAMARIRYLFPLLQVYIQYKDGEPEGKVKIFGFTAYDLLAPKEEKEKAKDISEDSSGIQNEENQAENIPEPVETDIVTETSSEKTEDADEPEEEKLSLIEKIRKFIKTLRDKIAELFEKLRSIREKGIAVKEKVTYYYEIWQREETQRAFKTAKKTLYKLWKSIRPKKGLLKLHFGTGDPGSTGQMCGYFGMLYSFLGKYVMIEPDFENKIYEGDFYFKGRITLFAFLKVAWIVLFDKDIKKLRKIFMN